MRISPILALFALLLPVPALAAPVTIAVTGADGKPLSGAVVTVEVAGSPAAVPHGTYTVAQRNIAFDPHVLIVPVGATVAFPNMDKVRHHVYSFSKAKKFDLKLYGRDDTRTVVFDQPGLVALGCNIHDSMSGFIFVTRTPFADQTDGAGRVALSGIPAGKATVTVWHPSIRAPNNMLSQTVTVAPSGYSTTMQIRR